MTVPDALLVPFDEHAVRTRRPVSVPPETLLTRLAQLDPLPEV